MANIEPEHPQGARSRADKERPLSDSELNAIPVARLSRRAKDVYRARRQLARGGVRCFARLETVARAMGVSSTRTVSRGDEELVEQGLARVLHEPGRRKVVELLRGPVTRDNLSGGGDNPVTPLNKEGSKETRERSSREQLSLVSTERAASPSPAVAGSAAKKRKRKTGWTFKHNGTAGTFVRDPEGTDRPPPGYFSDEDFGRHEREVQGVEAQRIAEEEQESFEARCQRAGELREWLYRRFGEDDGPAGELLGDGQCDDCPEGTPSASPRRRLGKLALCLPHAAQRHAVAVRLASEVAQAEVPL